MATVKETLNGIIARFESGYVPEAIAYAMFPIPNIPSANWSMLNRMVMNINGTFDARGIRQWNSVGRRVKRGAKAFYILVPRFVKHQNEYGDEEEILAGFPCRPVFRVQDTEGEPLDYGLPELPELPLIERAREWGIAVHAIPGPYRFLGCFDQERKWIVLASPEETVFFHELSHAAHARFLGSLLPGEDWRQEIVAELSAAALCAMVGKNTKFLGNSYRYISDYTKKAGLSPAQGCLQALNDTKRTLRLILQGERRKEESEQVFTEGGSGPERLDSLRDGISSEGVSHGGLRLPRPEEVERSKPHLVSGRQVFDGDAESCRT